MPLDRRMVLIQPCAGRFHTKAVSKTHAVFKNFRGVWSPRTRTRTRTCKLVLEDKDFPQGQQHCNLYVIRCLIGSQCKSRRADVSRAEAFDESCRGSLACSEWTPIRDWQWSRPREWIATSSVVGCDRKRRRSPCWYEVSSSVRRQEQLLAHVPHSLAWSCYIPRCNTLLNSEAVQCITVHIGRSEFWDDIWKEFRVWDKRIEAGRAFQMVDATMWKEREL